MLKPNSARAILHSSSPGMQVRHTSREQRGQIYLPWINRMLVVLTLAVVLGFKSSDNLGAAYGIAVVGTNTGGGSWWYSTNNGTDWLAMGSVSEASARLLSADAGTRLYFQPSPDWNGTLADAITFRAWDRSNGANGGLADATAAQLTKRGVKPVLEEGLAKGYDFDRVGGGALLAILANSTDTNIIARSSRERQLALTEELKALLAQTPYPDKDALAALDDRFIAENLSPGGSADLLALTWLLHFVTTEGNIDE